MAKPTHCLHCNQKIPILRRLVGEEYCSIEHAELCREDQEKVFVDRLRKRQRELPPMEESPTLDTLRATLSEDAIKLTEPEQAPPEQAPLVTEILQPFVAQHSAQPLPQAVKLATSNAIPCPEAIRITRVPAGPDSIESNFTERSPDIKPHSVHHFTEKLGMVHSRIRFPMPTAIRPSFHADLVVPFSDDLNLVQSALQQGIRPMPYLGPPMDCIRAILSSN